MPEAENLQAILSREQQIIYLSKQNSVFMRKLICSKMVSRHRLLRFRKYTNIFSFSTTLVSNCFRDPSRHTQKVRQMIPAQFSLEYFGYNFPIEVFTGLRNQPMKVG